MTEIQVPDSIQPRGYQIDAARSVIESWQHGKDSALLVMPTGCGKTITAGLVIKYAVEQMKQGVLFVAHRGELIEQAANTFTRAFGFATAIEKAESNELQYRQHFEQEAEVVVASVQSLYPERLSRFYARSRFGVIVIDEAHRSTAASYQSMLSYFGDYKLLGITATPDGSSGDMSKVYEEIAYQRRFRTAVKEGDLVPITLRKIPVPVDLREMKKTAGDYNLGELASRISPIVETLAVQLDHNVGDRQTVVFTPDVGSAMALADMLRQMGRSAEYVAGEGGKFGVSKKTRKRRLEKFRDKKFQIIICCDLLVEGWDCPATSCVVIARPTQKRHRYCQMVGRGTRPCPGDGKIDCLVIDLDWQRDDSSRSLCTAASLFTGQELDEEKRKVLSSRVGNDDRDVDLMELLDQVEQDFSRSAALRVQYTGRYAKIYESCDSSPFGVGKVLDLNVSKRRDFDARNCGPATEKQVRFLKSMGVEGCEKMSLWGASRLLSKLLSRERKGLASHQQVKAMLAMGVKEEDARMTTVAEAASILADASLKQGVLFF